MASPQSVRVLGNPGRTYVVQIQHVGDSFGTKPGSLTLNGSRLPIKHWHPRFISGPLPPHALSGPVVVTTADSSHLKHDATEFTGTLSL
jgi:hypothetical protein